MTTENNEPNKTDAPEKMSLKLAYGLAVGAPAAAVDVMTLLWPGSLFIAFFTAGGLTLAHTIDSHQKGEKNTMKLAWSDYKEACSAVRADIRNRLSL